MTCVVAVAHEGIVYMGADSGSVGWPECHVVKNPKIFRCGEAVVGFTSSWWMGQVLQYGVELPAIGDEDLLAHLIRNFIPKLREAARSAGILQKDKDVDALGQFLVGLRGRIFFVDSDLAVLEREDYGACGSGSTCALGSLHSTNGGATLLFAPQERVRMALSAAAHHVAGIRLPFHYLRTEASK